MTSAEPIKDEPSTGNGTQGTASTASIRQKADPGTMSTFKRDHTGEKKLHDGGPKKSYAQKPPKAAVRNEYTPMFEYFRNELDQHHERRERITKASRDVTALSKKIIFALQRVRKIQGDLPEGIKKDVDARLDQISKLMATMAPDVQGINRYRYNWQLMCLEELVEALTFAHYLKTQSLISLEDLRAITDDLARRGAQEDAVMADADASTPAQEAEAKAALPHAPTIHITEQDYLYGVFDLTGEMMRFATTSTALTRELAGGSVDEGTASRRRTILQDMQELGSFFEMLPQNRSKQWTSKFDVLRQSVRKVERIGYDMVVRGSEREKGWVPAGDDDAGPDE